MTIASPQEAESRVSSPQVGVDPTPGPKRAQHACERCGKPHQAHGGRQRYCSVECYRGAQQLKPGVVMRRYCPACGKFAIAPDAERCECGALPSKRYPTPVEVDLEPEEVEVQCLP